MASGRRTVVSSASISDLNLTGVGETKLEMWLTASQTASSTAFDLI